MSSLNDASASRRKEREEKEREDEVRYYESFVRARPDLQLTNAVHSDKPDYRGLLEGRSIGIEITRFSPVVEKGYPRPEQQESLQRWTMELAQKAHRSEGGAPLQVRATFRAHPPLTKSRAPELARELADYLLASKPKPWIEYHRSALADYVGDTFLYEIEHVQGVPVPVGDHDPWYAEHGGWVMHADEKDISRTVATKESKVRIYRESCDELWLLIVFEMLAGDTYVRPPGVSFEGVIPTDFDRVFCLALVGDRCVEVQTIPLASRASVSADPALSIADSAAKQAMTPHFAHAFRTAQALPDDEQDALAAIILAEIDDERRWTEAFYRSPEVLADLAAEALAERRAGRTLPPACA